MGIIVHHELLVSEHGQASPVWFCTSIRNWAGACKALYADRKQVGQELTHFTIPFLHANVASLITRVGLFSVLVCSKCSKPENTCFFTTSHLRHIVLECWDGQVPSAYATDKRAKAGGKPRGLCTFPQGCADPSWRTRAPSLLELHPTLLGKLLHQWFCLQLYFLDIVLLPSGSTCAFIFS